MVVERVLFNKIFSGETAKLLNQEKAPSPRDELVSSSGSRILIVGVVSSVAEGNLGKGVLTTILNSPRSNWGIKPWGIKGIKANPALKLIILVFEASRLGYFVSDN